MKTLLIMLFCLTILCTSSIEASGQRFGLGVIIGEPTGPTFKLWTGKNTAIAGAAEWSSGANDTFYFHVDYLLHNYTIKMKKGKLPLYYGIGGRAALVEHNGDDIFGARIPLGIEYLPHKTHLGVFLEITPILDLVPDTDTDIEGAVGIRFYF